MRGTTGVRSILRTAALAALVALAGCEPGVTTAPMDRVSVPNGEDAYALALVHEINVGRVEAATLALQKAERAPVRTYARLLQTTYTELDASVLGLALELGLAPALRDQQLPAVHRAEMQLLTAAAGGAAFDAVYVAQQIAAHERTLALTAAELPRAGRAEVRMLLDHVRQTATMHLGIAQQVRAGLAAP